MRAMKTLVRLEYSRYNLFRHGKYSRILWVFAAIVLLFITALNLPGTRRAEYMPFIYASLLLWIAATVLAAIHILLFKEQNHQVWFLTFPHSRLKLLYAKLISLLRYSLNLTLGVLIAAVTLYYYSIRAGWYEPLPASGLLGLILSYILFILAFLPLAVTFGLAVSLFLQSRSSALLLLPYSLLCMAPFLTESILRTGYPSLYPMSGSPVRLLSAALALILIGWPLCHLLLMLIAAKGLEAGSAGRAPARTACLRKRKGTLRMKQSFVSTGRLAPFQLLYRLHKGRLYRIERHPAILILKLAAPLLFAVAAYFGFAEQEEAVILVLLKPLFALLVMLSSIWMLSRKGIERRQLSWLMGFPQSRLALLLSGVALVWTVTLRIMTVLILSTLAGSLATLITGRTGIQEWAYGWTWLLYSFLLSTLALTVILGLLQVEYYTMKSRVLSLLMFPVALLGPLHGMLLNRFYYPELHGSIMPDWDLLGWTALIGLPAAVCCILAGARYYHLSLSMPEGKKEWSNQA